jgi:hypothetical protein
MKTKKPQHCLFPKCPNKPKTRGLCNSHVTAAYGLIAAGKVTEDELVKRGRMLPSRFNVRKWFLEKEEGGAS